MRIQDTSSKKDARIDVGERKWHNQRVAEESEGNAKLRLCASSACRGAWRRPQPRTHVREWTYHDGGSTWHSTKSGHFFRLRLTE